MNLFISSAPSEMEVIIVLLLSRRFLRMQFTFLLSNNFRAIKENEERKHFNKLKTSFNKQLLHNFFSKYFPAKTTFYFFLLTEKLRNLGIISVGRSRRRIVLRFLLLRHMYCTSRAVVMSSVRTVLLHWILLLMLL